MEEFHTDLVEDFEPPSAAITPRLENVQEEEDVADPRTSFVRFVEPFPADAASGLGLRKAKTPFEDRLEVQESKGNDPWEPFTSREEWELAEWLLKNVGQKSTNEFLKLHIVCLLSFFVKKKVRTHRVLLDQ